MTSLWQSITNSSLIGALLHYSMTFWHLMRLLIYETSLKQMQAKIRSFYP